MSSFQRKMDTVRSGRSTWQIRPIACKRAINLEEPYLVDSARGWPE